VVCVNGETAVRSGGVQRERSAPPRRGALLVCGTASDVGKSLVTAGICRSLVRRGVRVAPFKAPNMSNNSAVTASGAEIGRAQAMQAAACGIEPEAVMNPVLIKPAGETSSQVLLMGKPYGDATARSYQGLTETLRQPVLDALDPDVLDALLTDGVPVDLPTLDLQRNAA
jgi:cobyric acid synthase